MPTFGTHDTDSRILLTGGGGVFVLKLDHSRAIKVFQPSDYFFTDTQLRPEVDAFLLRAKLQRLLAKSSKNWAPVHEISVFKEHDLDNPPYPGAYRAAGAYVITNRYERSVQSLIDGHVHVTNDDLRNIFTQVVSALIDAKKSPLKRAHGALKPSNILLTNSAVLSHATVHLADPAPDGALSYDHWSRDANELGKILFELVLLRPYTKEPIGASREWKALGPNGEDWRKLTTALLDAGAKVAEHPSMAARERRSHGGTVAPATPAPQTPQPPRAPSEQPDLDKILAEMSTWTLQPKKAPVIPITIAASILLIGGVTGLYFLLRTPTADFDQPTWARLCLNYGTWFDTFSDTASSPEGRAKLTAADFPANTIALFDQAVKSGKLATYSPYNLSGKSFRLNVLAVQPTPDAKSGKNAYITREAVTFIDQVDASLEPDQWPTLKNLQATAADYRTRQWFKPANAILAIVADVKPPIFSKLPAENADPPDITRQDPPEVARINAAVTAYHSVTDIDARWKRILAAEKNLPQTSVPLLTALPAFAESLPRTPDEPGKLTDLTSLADSFSKVETLINQLNTDLNKKDQTIVFDELAKDPGAQVPPGGPTLASYTNLPALAQAYVKLPVDPRDAVPFQKTLADVQTTDIDVINRSNSKDDHLGALKQRYQDLTAAVAQMNALSPIQKNREQLVSLVTANHAALDTLNNDAANWSQPYKVDPPVYIAKRTDELTNSPLAKGSPALYAAWKSHHSALLDEIKVQPDKLKDYTYYDPINQKFDNLAKAFQDLQDKTLPATVTGLSAMPADPAWAKNIAIHVAVDDREKALADLAANVKYADGLPQFSDASYKSYETQRLKAFDDLRVATLDLIADFTTIQARLDHLDLLPNEPAQGDKSWRDLFAKWNGGAGGGAKSPLLDDDIIVAALRPISDRVNALLKVDSLTDYPTLAADADTSPAPELSLTAWRKLGTIPITEADPVLTDETKSQAHLTEQFSTLSKSNLLTPAHAASLNAELTAAKPVRWRRYADVLVKPDPIQAALEAAPTFNVTLSAQADPRMTFNAALNNLRAKFQATPRPDDAQLKTLTKSFLDTVNALPVASDPIYHPATDGPLARLAKPLKSTAEQESSNPNAGPALAHWDQTKPREGIVVYSFTPPGATKPTQIEFDRVEVDEGNDQKQIYLSSTEVSVGLLADVLNSNPTALAAITNAKDSDHWLAPQLKRKDFGIRSWQIDQSTVKPNDTWIFRDPLMAGNPFYPATSTPPPPSLNSPVQNITPYSAMFFARLLGCRLPTTAEWQTAVFVYESRNSQKDAWNLRGSSAAGPSWATQQAYTTQLANGGLQYPDTNVLAEDFAFQNNGKDAIPFTYDALNATLAKYPKLALTGRLSANSGTYNANTLWFRDVGHEPGLPTSPGSGAIHDLIGNVAEFVFDAPNASDITRDNNASTADVEKVFNAAPKAMSAIGGSSLGPPQLSPFDPQPVPITDAQTDTGFADVGFRLAYTAPLETISEALNAVMKSPPYLPGKNAPH